MKAQFVNGRAVTLAFRLGVRQAVEQPGSVTGQIVILVVLLVSYGALLPAIPATDLQRLGLTATQMIWYLAITESVVMSISMWNMRQLQQSIRSGAIEIWMARPVDFWMMIIAEWAGRDLPRLLPLSLVAFAFGWIMSGAWLIDATTLVLLLPTAIASAIIILCWHFIIGMLTVWVSESSPAFWLYQKSLFLLGGLMWPLALYPVWMQTVAWITPFPAILATPGNLVLTQSPAMIAKHAIDQVFWIIVWITLCARTAKAAQKRLKNQ